MARGQLVALDLENAGRSANYSTSVRLSEKPSTDLAVRTPAPTRTESCRARPGRYKSEQYGMVERNARPISSTLHRAGPGLLLVYLTSLKRNRGTTLDVWYRRNVLSPCGLQQLPRQTFL